jgi:hypothetical protein
MSALVKCHVLMRHVIKFGVIRLPAVIVSLSPFDARHAAVILSDSD